MCQRSAARACEGSRFTSFLAHSLGISFAVDWMDTALISPSPEKAAVALHAGSLVHRKPTNQLIPQKPQ